jgi:hypothetical protein
MRTIIIKVTLFPNTNFVLKDLIMEKGQLIAKLINMATSKILKSLANITPYISSLGVSQNSVNTPKVDLGCKKAILSPSAPFLGALSINCTPLLSTSANDAETLSTQKAK